MEILYIIPARGGSKGIPHKNIKLLAGKPLICYSIDVARKLTTNENICVSTDDTEIIKIVEEYGLKVPFKRPDYLATDTATTNDVLLHATEYYEAQGKKYDVIVLLQPTSPLRKIGQLREALELYKDDLDMVVSVKESHVPAVLCNENREGFLELSFNKTGARRQDISCFFEYNGAIYVINIERLKQKTLGRFSQIKKYVMDELTSVDIDTPLDWLIVEQLIQNE
jgi:CMP-N,N'-diacetyllegionaminic acid synthase